MFFKCIGKAYWYWETCCWRSVFFKWVQIIEKYR